MILGGKKCCVTRQVLDTLRRVGVDVSTDENCVQVCGQLGCVTYCFGNANRN